MNFRYSTRRRRRVVTTLVAALCCLGSVVAAISGTAQPAGVRLALVNVPDDVLRPLLPTFEKQHGLRASIVYTGNDPFGEGRAGRADLIVAHFGHAGVEPFVTAGLGLWPKAVLANQMALMGPSADRCDESAVCLQCECRRSIPGRDPVGRR